MKKLFTLLTLALFAVSGAWASTQVTWTASNADVTTLVGKEKVTVGSGTQTYDVWAVRAKVDASNTPAISFDGGVKFGDNAINKSGIAIYIPATADDIESIEFYLKTSNSRKTYYASGSSCPNSGTATTEALAKAFTAYDFWSGGSYSKNFYYAVGGKTSGSGDVYLEKIVVTFAASTPDVTSPTLSTSNPADGATNVALSGNITLTFSENVTIADASKFTLTGGVGTLSTASATASGATVTIPYSGLAASTAYTFSTAAGAVEDEAGNANAALSDIAFTTTSDTYEFTAPVKYALAEGAGFTSGQTVNVTDAGTIVATITYGETGGEEFKAAVANGSITGYTAFTEGNGTNGNKAKGTWYTIVPKYDAVISVAVVLNSGKAFYVEENGVALSNYNGITVDEKYYGTFEFKATKDKSYKVYCSGSKLGFYGFTMSPYTEATIATSGYTSLASSYALDFTKAVKSASGDDALTAYAISAITKTSVTLTAVEQAPAGEGLILKGTAGKTYTIPALASADAITNELSGAVTATAVAASSTYALSGGVLKLFTGTEIPAGKAYLLASKVPASANELTLDFSEGGATGIQSVENTQIELLKGDFYNLAGQRVAQPTKGLYIVNGKKVIVK